MKKTPPLGKMFKRNRLKIWQDVSPIFGNLFHDYDAAVISRGQKLSAEYKKSGKLPAVLDNSRTVTGELIPYTSWGSSLSNMLTRDSWNELRRPLIKAHNNVCELCGVRLNSLDVHEIWSFQHPKQTKKAGTMIFGIQKLDGLVAVCSDCHRCFHLGRETAQGTLEPTLLRLGAINNWTPSEVKTYSAEVFRRWEFNSKINWVLDLSLIQPPSGTLIINDRWKRHPQDPDFLTSNSDFGPANITKILNCPWRF
ncbi:MAG: hypothetical protein RSG77_25080 [Hafnia sp.]